MMAKRKSKKRESPKQLVRVAEAAATVAKTRPVRETVVIHTTRERKRNAGFDRNSFASAAAMGGGSVVGGAASVVVAEKAKLDPFWAGLVTGGTTLALAQLTKKIPLANKALIGASLGAGGLCGVQLIASYYAKKQHADQAKAHDTTAKKDEKRKADGDSVTRTELNDALSKTAEEHKATTSDLMTALREEIKADIRSVMAEPQPASQPAKPPTNVIRVASFRGAGDEGYERNAYGGEDERNAHFAVERDAGADERDAGPPWERDADGERDAGADERDADPEWERNAEERDASAEERDADPEWERNAEERDAGAGERDADPEWERNADFERDAGVEEHAE
jgi:hypothetical protein